VSKTIKADASASEMRDAITTVWMRHPWRANVYVKRLDLDSDGIDITISNGTLETIRYTVYVDMLIGYGTQKQIIVSASSSKSIITT